MPRIAIYGLSANPPGLHHRRIVMNLTQQFDRVIVVPCGPRPDKLTTNDIAPIHRAVMTDLTFGDIPKVTVDLTDLEQDIFTRTWTLLDRYSEAGECWLVVGSDLIIGGANGQSIIQLEWEHGLEIWQKSIMVVPRHNFPYQPEDLPPQVMLLPDIHDGSSTEIREKVFSHQAFYDLVMPAVAEYIERHGLYRGMQPNFLSPETSIAKPRVLCVIDSLNPRAGEIAEWLTPVCVEDLPNCIVAVGGDGFMLQVIREHWRKRLPIIGLNAGHRGFLLNEFPAGTNVHSFFRKLTILQSPLLYVTAVLSNGSTISQLAFNDAWLRSINGGQAAWLEVTVDDEVRLPKLVGDGALIATAGGSTSYARALGVKPMPVGTQQIILAGMNVFEPFGWGPVHLGLSQRVQLRSLDSEKRGVEGFVDGIPLGRVISLDVRVSRIAAAELAFLPGNDPQRKILALQFPEH
ncbi:MAG: NAD(+)/NADH kinase [Patescibacteria group bacterium]|jgi:NAD kinase